MQLEKVALFGRGEGVPRELRPGDFFHLAKLKEFFSTHPVVLPFQESPGDKGFLTIVNEVLVFLVGSPRELYTNHAGLGGYGPSWKSFQYELALEDPPPPVPY